LNGPVPIVKLFSRPKDATIGFIGFEALDTELLAAFGVASATSEASLRDLGSSAWVRSQFRLLWVSVEPVLLELEGTIVVLASMALTELGVDFVFLVGIEVISLGAILNLLFRFHVVEELGSMTALTATGTSEAARERVLRLRRDTNGALRLPIVAHLIEFLGKSGLRLFAEFGEKLREVDSFGFCRHVVIS